MAQQENLNFLPAENLTALQKYILFTALRVSYIIIKIYNVSMIESSARALLLPIFGQHQVEGGDPIPRGIARYCTAETDKEVHLLSSIFNALNKR